MKRIFSREKTSLEKIIGVVEAEMLSTEPGSPEYEQLLDKYERLYKVKNGDEAPHRDKVKLDVVVIVVGNLVGVAMLMVFEDRHVIGQKKAWGQLIRPKIPGMM